MRAYQRRRALNTILVSHSGGSAIFIAVDSAQLSLTTGTFVPPSQGGFIYGWAGSWRAGVSPVLRYIGLNCVDGCRGNSKSQRNLPIGILGSLTSARCSMSLSALILTALFLPEWVFQPDCAGDPTPVTRPVDLVKIGR